MHGIVNVLRDISTVLTFVAALIVCNVNDIGCNTVDADDLVMLQTRSSSVIFFIFHPVHPDLSTRNIDFLRTLLVKRICLSSVEVMRYTWSQWLTFQTNPNYTTVNTALDYNVYDYVTTNAYV